MKKCVTNYCALVLLFFISFCCKFSRQAIPTIDEKIRDDPDLSQFWSLIEASKIAKISLELRHVTIFAPTNQAFQKYTGRTDVLYHITNQFITLDDLSTRKSISTEMDGNPPLWITVVRKQHRNDIYVNNAKIHRIRSDYVSDNRNRTTKQVLHIIDEVLVPVLPTAPGDSIPNPYAYTFLNRSDNVDIGEHRVRSYRHRVQFSKKDDVFLKDGRHTFFIPVDEGFKPPTRPDKIDARVIDGHIIPNHVLFTHCTPNSVEFQTLAFSDMLEVTISFETNHESKHERTMIKSNTLRGTSNFAAGVVLAEIVKANIPVRNGVIHLIQRPLMVVDTNVTTFLEEQRDGLVNKFHQLLSKHARDFMNKLNKMRDLTLFVPSNEALNDTEYLLHDNKTLPQVLGLHLVEQRLPLDIIEKNNLHSVPTVTPDKKRLYFNVVNTGTEKILTVEGGGVNATVIQPNIATTNGIIHIIDRVLGVPYTNILDKLRSDPMLNDTYFLGKADRFNDQLSDRKKNFTYFVPRDKAWRDIELKYPSTHKKLFMKEFSYHATSILERHLAITDEPLTMSRLKLMANESADDQITIRTVRDTLKLRIKEGDSKKNPKQKTFQIEWQNEWITVFRPDVVCTNGIIHVIDKPFLIDSDIRVNGGATNGQTVFILLPHLVMIFLAKWLLL